MKKILSSTHVLSTIFICTHHMRINFYLRQWFLCHLYLYKFEREPVVNSVLLGALWKEL